MTSLAPKYYRTVREVRGPLLIVEKTKEVGYGEIVRVLDPKGGERSGSVIETGEGYAIVQVFEGTSEIDADKTAVTFLGDTLKIPVSQDIVGRVGPLLVIYTKHPQKFAENEYLIRQLAKMLQKRITIRPDPSVLTDSKVAEKRIRRSFRRRQV